MHTFFINTSQKSISDYDVLFDIHRETKSIITMDCLMSEWYDKEKGYVSCINHMSDMIDGHVELNNAFNLIIYIDLSETKAYSSIKRDSFHDKIREEYCRALHIIFTHVVSESIVKDLSESGRKPQSVLIMFGEEKKFTDFNVPANESSRQAVMKTLFSLMGLPEHDTIERIAKSVDGSDSADKIGDFKKLIFEACGEEIIPGIREGYSSGLDLWFDEIITEANVANANTALFNRISSVNRMESSLLGVEVISCPYDYLACRVNRTSLAISQINIVIHLLKCVEANSIYESNGDGSRKLIAFHTFTVEEIAPILIKKKLLYAEKISEIDSLTKSYTELGLSPQLSAFDYAKFGLDEYGDKATDLVISAAEPDEKKSRKSSDAASNMEAVVISGNEKKVTVEEKESRAMLSGDEFEAFDYNLDFGTDAMLKKNAKPEDYIEQAKKVRRHHLDYLKKKKLHVSKVLSNYAGRSKTNKPAMLKLGENRYASASKETRALEAVETVSDKAYETAFLQYMEFCSGRSVAVTDIEEQCDWFISRVYQIKESINKIKYVAIGLFFAMLVLYIPFFVIQFEAITKNAVSVTVAMLSVVVPIAVLYAVFAFITSLQKKKYIEAWSQFKSKSDQILSENTLAAKKYDKLLSTIIPALRWIYEYKLDVDYCVECCRVADAKIEHHRHKLYERISTIQRILSDLEVTEQYEEGSDEVVIASPESVDYTASFCSGKKNRSFYSVIDSSFFNLRNN